jgi:hypothetical protein
LTVTLLASSALGQPAASQQQLPLPLIEAYLARKLGLNPVDVGFIAIANAQRTDQQTTATSSSPQSLSNLQKTGIADILALAVERGKVTQTKNDNSATLSTTPYAIATFFGLPDNSPNWQTYAWERHLALSGTFAKDIATSTDFSTFSTGEAKYVVYGSRSPRDAALRSQVSDQLDAIVAAALRKETAACSDFVSSQYGDRLLQDNGIVKKLGDWLEQHKSADKSAIDSEIATLIPDPQAIDTTSKKLLLQCVSATFDLGQTLLNDREQVSKLIDAYLKSNKALQLSVSYIYTRDLTVSDYTTYKVLLSRDQAPQYSLNLNGEINVNGSDHARSSPVGKPSPDVAPGAAIKRIRGYSIETGVSFGRFGNGRGDATLSMKWLQPNGIGERSSVTGSGQLNVHLNTMLTLPIALSYNSRATTTSKKGLQLTFGLSSLFDSFLSNIPH